MTDEQEKEMMCFISDILEVMSYSHFGVGVSELDWVEYFSLAKARSYVLDIILNRRYEEDES